MPSWQYAFLFPGFEDRLDPTKAISTLNRSGPEFDEIIRLLVTIDKQGHLLDVGEEVSLNEPIIDDLAPAWTMANSFQFSVAITRLPFLVLLPLRLPTLISLLVGHVGFLPPSRIRPKSNIGQ